MRKGKSLSTSVTAEASQQPSNEQPNPQSSREMQRRSFLKGLGVAGAALSAAPLLRVSAIAEDHGSISKGDAALLRFVAAAEIIESDIWLQYNELAGVQDGEVSKIAAKLIPGYPSYVTGGNPDYTADVKQLDGDMDQYISDNTEDELSHEVFLNAYLASKGAETLNLDTFRTLPSSQATGAKQIGRLTNLTQLTVDTSFCTRYRSRTNPDFGANFPQAIQRCVDLPAIPRDNSDFANADSRAGGRQHRCLPLRFHRAGRQQPVFGDGAEGTRRGSSAHRAQHRRRRSRSLPRVGRLCRKRCAGSRSLPFTDPTNGLTFPDFNATGRSGAADQPHLPGAVRIHQPPLAALRGHSSD